MPNRRNFLKSLAVPAAAAGFPEIVPASALGLDGSVPASDRVTLASIGVGWMGGGHVDAFLKADGLQYVALADLDDEHAAENKAKIDNIDLYFWVINRFHNFPAVFFNSFSTGFRYQGMQLMRFHP